MIELEKEFRLQIEKIMSKTKVTHIDSHLHIHAIPKIFDLVCKLAKEYGIKQVRTHFEKFYIVPDFKKHFCWKYLTNIFKCLLLEIFTIFNDGTIHKYELKTNDYIIGTLYSSMINALTVSFGIMAVKDKNVVLECFIHPSRYEDGTINNRFDETFYRDNDEYLYLTRYMGMQPVPFDAINPEKPFYAAYANCATDRTVLRSKTDAERSERTP
jgi:hypothetical protein